MYWLHAIGDAIAPEQQAGTDLIDSGAEDRGLGRSASPIVLSWNTAPQTAGEQGRVTFTRKQAKPASHAGGHLPRWVGESCRNLLGPCESIVHYQPPVHNQGDAHRRTPSTFDMTFKCKMEDCYIQSSSFAGPGRQV